MKRTVHSLPSFIESRTLIGQFARAFLWLVTRSTLHKFPQEMGEGRGRWGHGSWLSVFRFSFIVRHLQSGTVASPVRQTTMATAAAAAGGLNG